MCGSLVFSLATSKPKLIAYHSGRFVSYAGLGALAGTFGNSVFNLTSNPVASGFFILLFAATLLFVGWKMFSGQSLHFSLGGKGFAKLSQLKLPVLPATALTGFATILLPCGHLYTFALGAAATGSALMGTVMMTAFWMGTLPTLGFGVHYFKRQAVKLGPNRFRIAALILVANGFLSLGKFAAHLYSPSKQAEPTSHQLLCH